MCWQTPDLLGQTPKQTPQKPEQCSVNTDTSKVANILKFNRIEFSFVSENGVQCLCAVGGGERDEGLFRLCT